MTWRLVYTHLKTHSNPDELINHPSVVSGMYREGEEDYRASIPEGSISYLTELGGWIFTKIKPRVYDGHLLYLPEARGLFARNHSRWVFSQMSRISDKIQGEIALENKAACKFVEKLGCQLVTRKTGNYWIGNKKTDLGLYEYEFKEIR